MNDHLQWRYNVKKFDPTRKVSEKDFKALLEVLRLAPSSYGLQPWKFVVVRDPKTREEIRRHALGQAQVTEASHLVVICALNGMDEQYIRKYISHVAHVRGVSMESLKGYEEGMIAFLKSQTPQAMSEWMKRQAYIPLGMLINECARRKIDVSVMEGFQSSGVDEVLGLAREGVTAEVLCAIGYRAGDDRFAGLKKVRFESKDLFIER